MIKHSVSNSENGGWSDRLVPRSLCLYVCVCVSCSQMWLNVNENVCVCRKWVGKQSHGERAEKRRDRTWTLPGLLIRCTVDREKERWAEFSDLPVWQGQLVTCRWQSFIYHDVCPYRCMQGYSRQPSSASHTVYGDLFVLPHSYASRRPTVDTHVQREHTQD